MSFASFGFVFILPVLLTYEIYKYRTITRSLTAGAGLMLVYLALFFGFDFNYWQSFRVASALENPDGFRLFAQPLSYAFTRFENVAEIVLFLGPFLLVLSFKGLHLARKAYRDSFVLSVSAINSLTGMFLAGAFKTGETARACLFIYPFLLYFLMPFIDQRMPSLRDRTTLLVLVFGQTVLMQLFGSYFW
jgi:hypothetical protein